MTDFALMIIGVAALLIIPYWLLSALFSRRLWHCSECGFSTYEEHEALGHKEYHRIKHNMYQD